MRLGSQAGIEGGASAPRRWATSPGDFVGIACLPTASGGDGAIEVLIFPSTMKGTGEGSYPWDVKPKSTKTNGTVLNAVKDVDERTLTVSYKGQEKKIMVPEGVPIVTPSVPPRKRTSSLGRPSSFQPSKARTAPLRLASLSLARMEPTDRRKAKQTCEAKHFAMITYL